MDTLPNRLEIDSRLTELSHARTWIEAVADQYGLGEETRFSIHLCMEEALVNVVVHGYQNEPGHPIILRFSVSGDTVFIVIEDKAPPFSPLECDPAADKLEPASLEAVKPGGNGIRLLRGFAGSMAYERVAGGNRLTIGFPLTRKRT